MLGRKIVFDTNQDRDTHYAERWAEFAAAGLCVVSPSATAFCDAAGRNIAVSQAAEVADEMLKEYQARFGWVTPGGSGPKEDT